MKAEILSTGDELTTGAVVDSNSAYIAEKLEESGIKVMRHSCVADDMDEIVSVIKEISVRSDIAVVTGGLGPTTDDLTSEAAATAAEVELALDKTAQKSMEDYFKKRKWPVSLSNRKQTILPSGAKCLVNPVGTAPGFLMKIAQCSFFFLPGVPHEMRRMLSDSVLPLIQKIKGEEGTFNLSKTICLFGLPEASVNEMLEGLPNDSPEIKLGLRAKFPAIHVKLYGRGNDENELKLQLEKASSWVTQKLDKWVFSVDGASMETEVGKLLSKNNSTIAVAESCTGGLISHRLTNVSGSSDYFLFTGVTYANQAKMDVLGVSPDTLTKHGAVSKETVKEMAAGARKLAGATYGIATSGIAGPTGGTKDKPVGTVCIGISSPTRTKAFQICFSFGIRTMNKEIFAMAALDALRREILGINQLKR